MGKPLYQDPDYVQGQIAGIKAMVLALTDLFPADDFREAFSVRLESLRTSLLDEPISEARLIAIEHLEKEIQARLT